MNVYNFTLLNSMARQLLMDCYIITSIAPTMTSREMPKNPILQPMSERRAKWLQPLKMMFTVNISESSLADAYQEFEVEIGQTIRKGYQIIAYGAPNNPEYSFKTIEGIGVDCGFGDLLVPYRTYITGINSMSGLSAVYENGELVYKGCKYDEAQQLKNPDAITTVSGDKQAVSMRYYNLAGVESAEPQPGVNIKVTTYSDGTRTTEKVIK